MVMPIGQLLLKLKKAENIKRYQVERNLVPRSVAEHSDFVMKLCYVLAKWEERKFGNRVNWKKLYGCTFHDGIEAWTGDILSYTKRTVPEMMEAVRLTEESFFESGMRKDIPTSWLGELRQFVLNPKDDTIEGKILEAADTLDVIFECREEVIRHNKDPFEKILISSLEKLMSIDLESCKYFLKYPLNDLNLHQYYSESFKGYIADLHYDEIIFENANSVPEEVEVIKVIGYDKNTNIKELKNNSDNIKIMCLKTNKLLSEEEVISLELFVNPLDRTIFKVNGSKIARDENYSIFKG